MTRSRIEFTGKKPKHSKRTLFLPSSSTTSLCLKRRGQFCSVLAISYLGAKHDFEIWAFEVFFLWTRKTPLKMASRGSDLNIKMVKNTQEIHHKA